MNSLLREIQRAGILGALLLAFGAGVGDCGRAAADEVAAPAAAKAKGKKREKGFTKLLQGDPAKTWVGYNKEAGWPDGWELADGVLHRKSGGGDLQTVEEFQDFDLRFAWKVSEGGNSGVMYRVSREKGPAYETGPEYQVLDNAKHRDGKSPLTSSGSLYALYAPEPVEMKPAGEWNTARIVVKGNHIQHFLNGNKVVDAEIGSEDWNKRLAASKFASWPKFTKNNRGFVVIQDHGDEVWFRNVRIKKLKAGGGPEADK
jgi:hypothetical protein